MKLVAHCLVCNEENFIWYAIQSVIGLVDQVIVWDTGSSDQTCQIIENIQNSKIKFAQKGQADARRLSNLRQEMLERTSADWIWILDGDEIWTQQGLSEVKNIIENYSDKYFLMVHRAKTLVGDVYHYLGEDSGRYRIAHAQGHLNIRLINTKIAGLHVAGDYPNEAYQDKNGLAIQNFPPDQIYFATVPYFHASFLKRSSVDWQAGKRKIRYELGNELAKDDLPEVFWQPIPGFIPGPPKSRSWEFIAKSILAAPARFIKGQIGKIR
ncbi:glycosyltransferase [Candidatus Daviesbacteria bacterium]|nr:glycosyltransferase [Candidatus Daviesbacteria bacterium]